MLKSAIEKIQELSQGHVFNIEGENYSDVPLRRIEKKEHRPTQIKVSSLESIIYLVKDEATKRIDRKIFVEVTSPTEVTVYTTYDEKYRRDILYVAEVAAVHTPIDKWVDKESLLIALNSVFVPTEDVDYIQNVLQKISEESKVTSTDNGLGQSIEAQKGIALKENIVLKRRVTLRPYRTFLEVEQPESNFILRAREHSEFLIKSADGGAWSLQARQNIKNYLIHALEECKEYQENKIVVMA